MLDIVEVKLKTYNPLGSVSDLSNNSKSYPLKNTLKTHR